MTSTKNILAAMLALILPLTAACGGRPAKSSQASQQTDTLDEVDQAVLDNQQTYDAFTSKALQRQVSKDNLRKGSDVSDIGLLGSAAFRGNAVIDLKPTTQDDHLYQATYMCKPSSDSPFSLWLEREGESSIDRQERRIVKVDGCGGKQSMATVSYPVHMFPGTQYLIVKGAKEASFVVVVHEIEETEQH